MAVKGRPARDIGEELDMTAKAVRQAKFRVTKKLRELLDDDFMGLAVVESQCRDASATTSPHWIDQ